MASKRRLRRKQCERKIRHETKEFAQIAAQRRSKATGEVLLAYSCKSCGGAHIGHPQMWVQNIIATRRSRNQQ